MNGCSHYVDAEAAEPEPLDIAFNEDETTRILAIAERYASFCRQHGRPVPRDPVRALLAAAESMALRLEYIATAYEHAQWQADGGVTN